MKKLWQKDWVLDGDVEEFETRSDIEYDPYILTFDLLASYAHAKMLKNIGVLSETELEKVYQGLSDILSLVQKNTFALQFGEEDIHTKIENFLTENFGDVGKKIHTGRSRNDQVLTALRLFSKNEILSIWDEVLQTATAFLTFAQKYEFTHMPGYTHMQKAMPSTFGMWAGSFAEGCLDNIHILKAAYTMTNQSPLGSAASYGVPLPLNRELTSHLLGFEKVQSNSLYCQNSRGKIESVVLASLTALLFEVNKFAADVLLFSTEEFNILEIDEEICSSSSIMPQKKNVDLAELLRSKIHSVAGNYIQIVSMVSNLPSGYNRDFQDTKKPLIESLLVTKQCLKVTRILLGHIKPSPAASKAQMSPSLFATHHTFQLIKKGIPFRDAYVMAAEALKKGDIQIPDEYVHLSSHVGGTGNLQLSALKKHITYGRKKQKSEREEFEKCLTNLLPHWKENGAL